MKDQFLNYAQWLAQQSNVVASISFIYHYSFGIEDIIGTENSCETTDILKIYAKQAQTRSASPASYLCSVSGLLTSLSISGSMTVSKIHTGVPGHYFIAGYDVVQNQWYTFNGSKFTLTDFTENTITSIPSGGSGLAAINGPIFINSDVSPYKGGMIYLAYGLGSTKWAAWQEMLTNHRYVNCAVIPQQ